MAKDTKETKEQTEVKKLLPVNLEIPQVKPRGRQYPEKKSPCDCGCIPPAKTK